MDEKRIGVGFGVMVLRDGNILLGKRHDNPEKAKSALRGAGTWTMPGGKLKFGESFEQGAARELMEETGIVLKSSKVIALNNDQVEGAHFVTIGLLCEDFEGEASVREPDEITEWGWFRLDALPQPIFFASEKVLKNYFEKKIYL